MKGKAAFTEMASTALWVLGLVLLLSLSWPARIKAAEPTADVTYEQILKDPDNPDLNIRYAQQQIKAGNLRGALAPLERVLLVRPRLLETRLLYADVLLRLKELSDAERELNALSQESLPKDIDAQVRKSRREISGQRERMWLSGLLAYGFEAQSNRNSSPSSNERLLFGHTIVLDQSQARRADTLQLFTGKIEGRRQFGADDHEAFVGLEYYRGEATMLKYLNLEVYSPRAGGLLRSRWADLTLTGIFDHVRLAQTTLLRNHGAGVRIDKELTDQLSLDIVGTDVYQAYTPTELIQTAKDRDGIEANAGAGLEFRPAPRLRLRADYSHGWKHAVRDIYIYDRDAVSLGAALIFYRGMYAYASGTAGWDRYPYPDTLVTQSLRRDNTWRATVGCGLPLKAVSDHLPPIIWGVGYEYYQSISTVLNYGYTNNKITTQMTYRWDTRKL